MGYSKQMKAQLISSKPIWAQIDLMDEINKNQQESEEAKKKEEEMKEEEKKESE